MAPGSLPPLPLAFITGFELYLLLACLWTAARPGRLAELFFRRPGAKARLLVSFAALACGVGALESLLLFLHGATITVPFAVGALAVAAAMASAFLFAVGAALRLKRQAAAGAAAGGAGRPRPRSGG